MNELIKKFLVENDLPLPETILYTPTNKSDGYKLLRYEINSNGIFCILEESEFWELTWTIEQLKKCTW